MYWINGDNLMTLFGLEVMGGLLGILYYSCIYIVVLIYYWWSGEN